MSDESVRLHGKYKVIWCLPIPLLVTRGALKGIESPVDLNRRKSPTRVLQLGVAGAAKILRIKYPSPGRVGPARDADPNPLSGRRGGPRSWLPHARETGRKTDNRPRPEAREKAPSSIRREGSSERKPARPSNWGSNPTSAPPPWPRARLSRAFPARPTSSRAHGRSSSGSSA